MNAPLGQARETPRASPETSVECVTPGARDTRRGRAIRAGAAAAVATVAAAAAHTVAGGSAPPPWLVAAVILLAWPVALVIVGRAASAPRTGLAVVAAQAMLHGAFAMVGDAAPSAAGAHGHLHAPLLLAPGAASPAPDAAMLGGHAIAAVVTVLAVCHGERMLRAVAAGIRSLLRRTLPTSPHPAVPLAVPATVAPAPVPALFVSDLSRRGPPC